MLKEGADIPSFVQDAVDENAPTVYPVDNSAGLPVDLPVVRDPDSCQFLRHVATIGKDRELSAGPLEVSQDMRGSIDGVIRGDMPADVLDISLGIIGHQDLKCHDLGSGFDAAANACKRRSCRTQPARDDALVAER